MSYPITACLTAKAIKGDPRAVGRLRERLKKGIEHKSFSYWPCECQPRCDADIEQADLPRLAAKLLEAVPEFALILADKFE